MHLVSNRSVMKLVRTLSNRLLHRRPEPLLPYRSTAEEQEIRALRHGISITRAPSQDLNDFLMKNLGSILNE